MRRPGPRGRDPTDLALVAVVVLLVGSVVVAPVAGTTAPAFGPDTVPTSGLDAGAASGLGAGAAATSTGSTPDATAARPVPAAAAADVAPTTNGVVPRGSAGENATGSSGTTDPSGETGPSRNGSGPSGNATVAEVYATPSKSPGTLRGAERTASSSGGRAAVRSAVADPARTRVVVELTTDYPADYRRQLRASGVRFETTHGRLVQATLPSGRVAAVQDLPWVRLVRRPVRAEAAVVSEGVGVVQADAVHATGVSGDGVRVGVVDFGFDPSAPEIAANVVAARSFTGDPVDAGRTAHGTAVSELVADTAPDAELVLARAETDVEFAAAVAWLRERDVDVITVSLNWLNQPYDGTGFVSRVADDAVADGIVWTNSAGNFATRHWESRYRNTDGDNWVEFGPGDERNYLNEGRPLAGRASVSLSWNDWPRSTNDYDLLLYRDVPPYGAASRGEDVIVARSTRAQTGVQRPTESVRATVDRGVYYVTVSNYDADGSHVLELYTRGAAGPLEHRTPSSSLAAPATARDVLAVGAFRAATGTVEPFSSRGPTNDGRRGVDVLGPDRTATATYPSFVGTSAAAPHVAGVSALVRQRNPGASPAAVERRIQAGATDVGEPGPDQTTGYGRLNAREAVFDARNRGVVAVGETVSSTIDRTDPYAAAFRGYHERVALDGRVGQRVAIGMRSTGDPYLVLLDPTGRVVGRDDDGGVGLDARLVHTFARTGRYTVVATSYRPEATFDYDLTVSALGAPGDPASDPVRLSLAANATTVEAGTPVAFTVTRADTGAPVNATLARDGETWVTGANGTALVPFDRPGTYRITATKPPTATERFAPDRVAVTVDPAATAAPPRFDVSSLSIPETVRAGETVRVAATVTNTGGRAGSSTVRAGVDLDGDGTLDPVGRERVDLDPGARHAFDRSVTVPGGIAPGRYAVGVRTANGTVTTTVTVADERG